MTKQPVPVIASFSSNGDIEPLYVRINDISLKVLQTVSKTNCTFLTFQCIVDDNSIEKHVTLTYFPKTTNIWYVEY